MPSPDGFFGCDKNLKFLLTMVRLVTKKVVGKQCCVVSALTLVG
jgi:hypothetical protein